MLEWNATTGNSPERWKFEDSRLYGAHDFNTLLADFLRRCLASRLWGLMERVDQANESPLLPLSNRSLYFTYSISHYAWYSMVLHCIACQQAGRQAEVKRILCSLRYIT